MNKTNVIIINENRRTTYEVYFGGGVEIVEFLEKVFGADTGSGQICCEECEDQSETGR